MTLTPSAALDTLISTELAHGRVTADLDPSTLGTLLSIITPQPLSWLWPGLIPRGTLTLLDGGSGVGTSLFALTLAACLSAGRSLPDQAQTLLTPANVLLLAPHNDPATTLVPRLSAAGADLSRILLLKTLPLNPTPAILSSTFTTRPFVLPRDLSTLTALIEYHQPALVILDHLSALMPSAPLSRLARSPLPITDPCAAAAPDLFTALAHLASATTCAILLVRHTFRGRPLSERCGTAPVQLLLLPDPRAQDQRLLCTAKNTLSAPVPNHTYQITSTRHAIPTLRWLAANPAPTQALVQAAFSSLPPNRQAILSTLAQVPGPLGPQDIAARTGLSYDLARRLLARMCEANEIARFAYGCYTSLDHPCLATRPPLHTSSFSLPSSTTDDLPPVPPVPFPPTSFPPSTSDTSASSGVSAPSPRAYPSGDASTLIAPSSRFDDPQSPAEQLSSPMVSHPSHLPQIPLATSSSGRGLASPDEPQAHPHLIHVTRDQAGASVPSSVYGQTSPTEALSPPPLRPYPLSVYPLLSTPSFLTHPPHLSHLPLPTSPLPPPASPIPSATSPRTHPPPDP